jgi:hypothetical protein
VIAAPHASNSTTTTIISQGSPSPPSHHWTTSLTCNTRSCNAAVVYGDKNDFRLYPCLASSVDAAPSTVDRLLTGRLSANPESTFAIVGRQHQSGYRGLDQKPSLLQPVRPPKWHYVCTTWNSGSTEHFVLKVTTVAQVSAFYSSVRPPSSIWSHEHH